MRVSLRLISSCLAATCLVGGFLLVAPSGIGAYAQAQQASPPAGSGKAQPPKAAPKQNAAPKAKAAPKDATEALIINARSVALTGLTLSNSQGKPVATQKAKIAPGKRATLKLPKKAGCSFIVSVAFEDGAEFDEAELNLCTDKTIRLTEGASE
jgi:hypothetical protein